MNICMLFKTIFVKNYGFVNLQIIILKLKQYRLFTKNRDLLFPKELYNY